MQGYKCRQCRFWAMPGGCDLSAEGVEGLASECRRRAPRLVDGKGGRVWPTTRGDDWCGEFQTRWGTYSCAE